MQYRLINDTFIALPSSNHHTVRSNPIRRLHHFRSDVAFFLEVDESFGAASFCECCFLFSGVDYDGTHAHCPATRAQSMIVEEATGNVILRQLHPLNPYTPSAAWEHDPFTRLEP